MATLTGSAGVALLLLAFLLNIVRLMPAAGRPYMLANLLGASLACYSSAAPPGIGCPSLLLA